MDVSVFLLIGSLTSGVLQIFGYVLYLRDTNIEPNPVAWLMFAYGTAILTVLEFDRNATVYELFLPTICAVMSMYVAYRCWRYARTLTPHRWWPEDWWPEDRLDRAAFVGDIAITIAYVGAWILMYTQFVTMSTRDNAALLFLIGSNATTFIAFLPLLRGAYRAPGKERALPWMVWTVAYALLFAVTFVSHGITSELIIYPTSCVLLHGLVAYLVRAKRRVRSSV